MKNSADHAQALRDFRTAHGLSQATLAEHLGVDTSTVLRWENGKTPTPTYLDMTLESLGRRLRVETLDIHPDD